MSEAFNLVYNMLSIVARINISTNLLRTKIDEKIISHLAKFITAVNIIMPLRLSRLNYLRLRKILAYYKKGTL